jgi:hypothetical protein
MSFSTIGWLIGLLPDSLVMWLFYGCAGLGFALILVSWFITILPIINRYRFPVQVVGVLLFGIGAYLSGGYGIEMLWRERVAEMEAKVKIAEEQSKKQNIVIQEKIVYKTKVIKQQETVYIDRIKEIAKEVDAKCEVDPRVIETINRASEEPK